MNETLSSNISIRKVISFRSVYFRSHYRYSWDDVLMHSQCLKTLGGMVLQKHTRPNGPRLFPTLMVVVLPEHGNEIYRIVK